tara:strand:+ start:394 stop:900 length:507 start_codon:yes stop_codon:yes gene_type:complete
MVVTTLTSKTVLVFAITATFDFLMNVTPPPVGAVLTRPYFEEHTVLSAALIAGFIGAFTYLPLHALGVTDRASYSNIISIFLGSALIGFPMEWSGMFPILQKHYYDALPRYQTFLADGLSGIMVAFVFWIIQSRYEHSITVVTLLSAVAYLILLKRGIILWDFPSNSA